MELFSDKKILVHVQILLPSLIYEGSQNTTNLNDSASEFPSLSVAAINPKLMEENNRYWRA